MTKYWRTFWSRSTLAISEWGGLPRSLTRMVPPWLWMSCTKWGVKSSQFSGDMTPLYPPLMPKMRLTPYMWSIITISRITEFNPGQRPPHVTMAAAVSFGSKWSMRRGPAVSVWKNTLPDDFVNDWRVQLFLAIKDAVTCLRGVSISLASYLSLRCATRRRLTSLCGGMTWSTARGSWDTTAPCGSSTTWAAPAKVLPGVGTKSAFGPDFGLGVRPSRAALRLVGDNSAGGGPREAPRAARRFASIYA
mmetsp:Transcript_10794/g.31961  ORF Transcript_10794/g.31961 Transcript_10794/m.31961 type:complete len:248 (-) Transcript_10794:637-1380(-)